MIKVSRPLSQANSAIAGRSPPEEVENDVEIAPQAIVSWGWLRRFERRHSERIKSVRARKLEVARAAVTPTSVEQFFSTLTQLYSTHHFDSRLVANFDESMVESGTRMTKFFVPRDLAYGCITLDDKALHITMASTVFADGSALDPLIILPQKQLPPDLQEELAEECCWVGQENGWMTTSIFEQYVDRVFIPEIELRRRAHCLETSRALLLLDGHASRNNMALMLRLQTARVDVVTFASHASHLMQPLDRGVFRAFKASLASGNAAIRNASRPEKRRRLLAKVVASWRTATTKSIIKAAFAASGICDPPNSAAVLQDSALRRSPIEASAPGTTKKRSGININNRVLTSDEAIEEMRIAKVKKEEDEQKRGKKRKRQK